MEPIAERRVLESKTLRKEKQCRRSKKMRKNFSVSMVNTRSAKENKTKVITEEEQMVPAN